MQTLHPLGGLAELALIPQWIPVRLVPLPNGKTDKLPLNYRTGKVPPKGSDGAHDPAIWTDYATVGATAAMLGPQFTEGFVLADSDPYFVVDIDDALQADGTWSPLALELCAALPGCVVEVSQSGTGLHLWGRSQSMPKHAAKNTALHIECYSRRRFIAIGTQQTGTLAPDCPAIADVVARYFPPRDGSGLAVPDEGPRADWRGPPDTPEGNAELLRRAMQSRSAASVFGGGKATFAELWRADADALARAYPSSAGDVFDRSSADAALFQHLAYWAGCDSGRAWRIAQGSALKRDKWDREDYIERTLARAASLQRDVLQDKPPSEALTYDAAEAQLRMLDGPAIEAQWVALALRLNPADVVKLIEWVSHRTLIGVGVRALNATLKEARSTQRREAWQSKFDAETIGLLQIEHRPDAATVQANEVERAILRTAQPGEYVAFGGALCHVTVKPLPYTHMVDSPVGEAPAVPQIEALNEAMLTQRVEGVAKFFKRGRNGPEPLAVPPKVLQQLLTTRRATAPQVTGLLTHPLALPNGDILAGEGLHAPTGLYLYGAAITCRPYAQTEAVEALARLRASFLEGFEFATPLDADAAIAALLTGVQRKVLDSAPGVAILASVQSSGKTTLARRLHVMLTGRDMPVSSFSMGSEEEARKALLAMLLRSPAMVTFDNVPDGVTFKSGAIAAALTAPVFTGRVLGVSREADAPTNVLFALTGNNLSLGNDEVTRWLAVKLSPRAARPQERQFLHADVMAHALAIRPQVLADVVGIVAGYLRHAAGRGTSASRFPAWDRCARQPLIWAGALDVAAVFRANETDSEPVRAHRTLLFSLSAIFTDRWFTAADVRDALAPAMPFPDGGQSAQARKSLREALESHRSVKMDSARSIAQVLQGATGRVADVEGRGLRIATRRDNVRNLGEYRAEAA